VEELEEEIAERCAHIDAATYRVLRAIGEVDRREAWPVGFVSMAHWLNWRVGIDLRTAREKVRVARALENLPLISEAFRQGRMSYSKVRAMCRIATPKNEGYLLYIAENGTTEDVERVVRGYRRPSREEDMEEARRQREEPYQVMIHVDSAVLADESEEGFCELETGDGISSETCRRLACDAPHVTAAEDEQGNLLNMGRKGREDLDPSVACPCGPQIQGRAPHGLVFRRSAGEGHSRSSRTLSHQRRGRRNPERGEPEGWA
jgi:hypothetical protein